MSLRKKLEAVVWNYLANNKLYQPQNHKHDIGIDRAFATLNQLTFLENKHGSSTDKFFIEFFAFLSSPVFFTQKRYLFGLFIVDNSSKELYRLLTDALINHFALKEILNANRKNITIKYTVGGLHSGRARVSEHVDRVETDAEVLLRLMRNFNPQVLAQIRSVSTLTHSPDSLRDITISFIKRTLAKNNYKLQALPDDLHDHFKPPKR